MMQTENEGQEAGVGPDLGDDLLKGAREIASFLGPSFTERGIFHLVEKGAIPFTRLPGTTTIYSRKSALRRAFQFEA
jgi:hypothetical protein